MGVIPILIICNEWGDARYKVKNFPKAAQGTDLC